MSFDSLLTRLIVLVRERVHNGQLTERGLARLTGISQPHMHNVLKGTRVLSPELADQIMMQTGLSVFDLYCPQDLNRAAENGTRTVPFSDLNSVSGENANLASGYSFSRQSLHGLRDPAVTYLAADPRMGPRFETGDLALFERDEKARTQFDRHGTYLVRYEGLILVRYIRLGGNRLYLVAENCLRDPLRWDFVSLADWNILEIVRGRIVWIGRQVASVPAEPAEEAGRDD